MRKIFLLLVLLWCIVPACASQIPREITDAIPDSARPFLEDTDKADNFTSWNSGLSTLWTRNTLHTSGINLRQRWPLRHLRYHL